jgi:drug/metabolite transporter (DMT)-like permease
VDWYVPRVSLRARIWTAFLAIYLIWGSTYLAIRFAIETLPPLLMAGTRFLVAGALLFGWLWLKGERKTTWIQWREAAVVGGLMLAGGNGGLSWAQEFVPSGLAALIVSTIPIWVVLLQWIWLKEGRPSPRVLLGLAFGFVGVALLIRPDAGGATSGEGVSILGAIVILAAAALWAAGGLYSRRAKLPASPLLAVAMEMVAGGVILFVAGTVAGEWPRFHLFSASFRSLLSLGYLIVYGSLIALTAYLWLIKETNPARAATYAFVNPVVALVLGWWLAGETLGPRTALAAVVAITGVVLIVRAPLPVREL